MVKMLISTPGIVRIRAPRLNASKCPRLTRQTASILATDLSERHPSICRAPTRISTGDGGQDERHFTTSFHRQPRGLIRHPADRLFGSCAADRLAEQADQNHRRLSRRRADRFVLADLWRLYPLRDRSERDRREQG